MKDKPAFPRAYETNGIIYGNEGMTLREYYAKDALNIVFQDNKLRTRMYDYCGGRRQEFNELMAKKAIDLADALIAELQKERG